MQNKKNKVCVTVRDASAYKKLMQVSPVMRGLLINCAISSFLNSTEGLNLFLLISGTAVDLPKKDVAKEKSEVNKIFDSFLTNTGFSDK